MDKTLNDTHMENCVSLNSVQEFIEIEAWLLLAFSLVYTLVYTIS